MFSESNEGSCQDTKQQMVQNKLRLIKQQVRELPQLNSPIRSAWSSSQCDAKKRTIWYLILNQDLWKSQKKSFGSSKNMSLQRRGTILQPTPRDKNIPKKHLTMKDNTNTALDLFYKEFSFSFAFYQNTPKCENCKSSWPD